ncbi:hypothetical protein [Jannaschia sp. M317]|uniref:tetratricopeptide repeat protein n=1 Tax=Jannaschia sp. M317 TaxID=2867011 RepID=UPI0021A348BE|nr:hypothetical protein [Jannaschia sp. M317]UWQ17948.1 hypothetical protein K3551_01145 [Jannaschia sp. M317]
MGGKTGLGRITPWLAGLALAAGLVPAQAQQAQLTLAFRPPQIDTVAICVSPPSDDETVARWTDWDGRVLPDRSMPDIRRDIRRLLELDGPRWADTADRAIALLQARDPAFVGEPALRLKIVRLEAAGAFDALTDSGLVAELDALGPALSPQGRRILSNLVRDGIGIARDTARADSLLTAAAYAGDPEAILALATRQLAGEDLPGWAVPVELAITTAFGTLVGELNPGICDRIRRIAQIYEFGGIVAPDKALAHDWYRFAADLGDGRAAWKVSEFHLRAEGFEKSNDLLLSYLQKAVDAGLPYARTALADILERGALLPQDLDRARALHESTGTQDARRGLVQLALFLDRHEDRWLDARAARLDATSRLATMPDAPGWAFTRLAEAALEDHGRWGGRQIALTLLQDAVDRGDLDGHVLMADLLLAEAPTLRDLDRAGDLLTRVADERGGSRPMSRLHAAHACRAPNAPTAQTARFWQAGADAIGTEDLNLSSDRLATITPDAAPRQYARLQSEALEGNGDGLARWQWLLRNDPGLPADVRAYWAARTDETDAQLVARARLDLSLAPTEAEREAILDTLRARYRVAGPDFAKVLTRDLFEGIAGLGHARALDETTRADIADLFRASASRGYGNPLRLLPQIDPTGGGAEQVYATYRAVIEANGDFAAQLFAASVSEDPHRQQALARAAGLMPCTYRSAMDLVALTRTLDLPDRTAHWLRVAEALLGDNTVEMVHFARAQLNRGGPGSLSKAISFFTEAGARGDPIANRELFRLVLSPNTPIYDIDRAVAMIQTARTEGKHGTLAGYLSGFRAAHTDTQALISARLDLAAIYRETAESGDPVAMRVHGLTLRDQAQTEGDLEAAVTWLRSAAEAGDTIAMSEYGEALAFGLGVAMDRAAALPWLERAAGTGNSKAQDLTRLLRLSAGSPNL